MRTTPIPWTYYSACDLSLLSEEWSGADVHDTFIIAIRDEAAISDDQSTFTSTTKFGLDVNKNSFTVQGYYDI